MEEQGEEVVRSDLADLVDYPRETLDVELKEWVDLGDKITQAKIARHISALANHGGGYLIFGFRDDQSIASERPSELNDYNRDTFGRIVTRYLSPPFQCDVHIVQASAGLTYPVVRVPSHGTTPICSEADGPHDKKGRPQGIRAGVYYIRKPGPKSEAISNAEEWRPLIRRCVLSDRDSLLSDFAHVALPQSEKKVTKREDLLREWHENSHSKWRKRVQKAKEFRWLVDIEANHCQLSYMILDREGTDNPSNELQRVMLEVNRRLRDTVNTGWSMFYPFTRPDIAAAFHPEFDDGSGGDVLESDLIGDGDFDISLPDYWRYTFDGRATIIRPYREDRQRSANAVPRKAGTWLDPETVLRETTELVTHARLMAEHFGGGSVAFRCSWHGLNGRELASDGRAHWSRGYVSRAGSRTTTGTWETAVLAANWYQVVADLGCPVLGLFGLYDCNAALVERLAPRFVKI